MEKLIAGTIAILAAALFICFAKYMQSQGFGLPEDNPGTKMQLEFNYDNTNLLK